MSVFRHAAAVVAVAAVTPVAACTAGITTAAPAVTTGSAASHSAPGSHTAAAGPSAPAGRMLSVGGSLGSFPIPAGASVAENITYGGQTAIILGSVTPAAVSSFYTAELPRYGYKITGNGLVSGSGADATAFIEFSGHGYKGTIGAGANLPSPGPSFPGAGKNFVAITLTRA